MVVRLSDISSKTDFEAMKTGKLAIWPWLCCRYTENTLMDEPCMGAMDLYAWHLYEAVICLYDLKQSKLQPFSFWMPETECMYIFSMWKFE